MPELPNVPTIAELGYPKYESTYWLGVATRAGTPKSVLAKLEKVMVETMKDPSVIKQMNDQNIYPLSLGAKELEARTNAEIAKWRKVVQATGIQE